MSDFIERWIAESEDNAKVLAEERLIVEVAESIWAVLEKKKLNKADLANLLEKERSDITQLLDGNRNMTLRTLADIAFALNSHVKVWIDDGNNALEWQDINAQVSIRMPLKPLLEIVDAENEGWNYLERLSA